MLLKIITEHISEHKLMQAVNCLQQGGVIIYPTDTVYAIGCDIKNHKAAERVKQMKETKRKEMNFSFVCNDLSQLSEYAAQMDTRTYKLMKRALPGPYTFILPASKQVPRIFDTKKKTIGIRVPDHAVTLALVQRLGNPILSTSLNNTTEIIDYMTDAEEIDEKFRKLVDMVVDCGPCGNIPSTIIDCTGNEPVVVREGLGQLPDLMIW